MTIHDRVRQRLKLRDLRLVLAVAERGSMAKAAKQLNLTQSGVSRAISDMEHTLGVRLFDRSAQGIEPTRYGEVLCRWGAAVFDDLRQGVNEIEFLADPGVGELRIGCAEPMLGGLLPVILDRLHRQHPRIKFLVRQVPTIAQQHRELRERTIDLVLGRTPGALVEDLEAEVLYEERAFVIAGPMHPLICRRNLKLADLVDQPWSLPDTTAVIGSLFVETFQRAGLPVPQVAVMATSIQLHAALLQRGQFLSMFPRSLLHFAGRSLGVTMLRVKDLPPMNSPVAIVTLKGRTISPVTQLFAQCARDMVKPLTRPGG